MKRKDINKDIKVILKFPDDNEKECIENIEDILAKIYAKAIMDDLKEKVTDDKIIETIGKLKSYQNLINQKIN